ncbi:DUF1667 domain-containing protein [Salisediminibacterium beveridgei]|uniref:CxxC motif-containing protein n=1 Tax=Salisediminibacterium beveridgei TaxID=632773 RepID=A0A1D7QX39_9BACI|nr:DUF1667 domain-containing protein [Salisediminibacterium beveridgei]AOM83575.1 hypothetical protein BBEV_2217 [Salisediminibacterium beveridgei]
MTVHELTCITCPIGCRLEVTVTKKGDQTSYEVNGNTCKRGEKYAIDELTNPLRMVTTTVKIKGSHLCRIPVKTLEPIPKGDIMNCMAELNEIELVAPVACGEIVVDHVSGSGIPVVTTRSMERI